MTITTANKWLNAILALTSLVSHNFRKVFRQFRNPLSHFMVCEVGVEAELSISICIVESSIVVCHL